MTTRLIDTVGIVAGWRKAMYVSRHSLLSQLEILTHRYASQAEPCFSTVHCLGICSRARWQIDHGLVLDVKPQMNLRKLQDEIGKMVAELMAAVSELRQKNITWCSPVCEACRGRGIAIALNDVCLCATSMSLEKCKAGDYTKHGCEHRKHYT